MLVQCVHDYCSTYIMYSHLNINVVFECKMRHEFNMMQNFAEHRVSRRVRTLWQ